LLPYGRQSIDPSDLLAVQEVLEGDWLTTGPHVEAFERDLSTWTGGHDVVAVTSGTAALHVAYAAAGVGPGDEVVTSPMTFVATASCAVLLGAKVVFADVEEDTANLDPEAAAAVVTSRTKVVAAVDYAGHPAEYDQLQAVTAESDILLLADAAHSIGSTYKGTSVGALADLTTLSFFPTKNMTTAEGGAVVIAERQDLVRRAREFRTIGLVRDRARQRYPEEGPWHQEVHEFGLNYRLPDVLCALGSSQLRRLPSFILRRAQLTARYNELLRDVEGIRLPTQRSHVVPAWHLYPVRVREGRRRHVFDAMRAAGIGVQVNYVPVYWHPVFEDLGYRRGQCPIAERFYEEELSLPLYPTLTEQEQDRVVAALVAALT